MSTEHSKRLNWESVRNFIRNSWRDDARLFLIAAIIVVFDQWTKALVRANVPLGGDWLPASLAWLMPFARIRHWSNTGAAFGFFQQGSLVFTILAVIVSAVIIYYFPDVSRRDPWLRLAMGILLGGSLGNLVDRLTFAGQVTDFISVGNFAVFNVADGSITVGVILLVLTAWISDRAEKKRVLAPKTPSEPEVKGE